LTKIKIYIIIFLDLRFIMEKLVAYIRENKNIIFIVVGQTCLLVLAVLVLYYLVTFIAGLPGFQFDPLLLVLIAFLGWQFWKILDKQNKIIERQNDLIKYLSNQQNQLLLGHKPEKTRSNLKKLKPSS